MVGFLESEIYDSNKYINKYLKNIFKKKIVSNIIFDFQKKDSKKIYKKVRI